MSDNAFVVRDVQQPGFVTTEAAYREFVRAARLRPLIATQLRRLREGADLVAVGAAIRTAYFDAQMPAEIAAALEEASAGLGEPDAELVVGSVVPGDQLDEFLTGPHQIFVGVSGQRALQAAVKRCWGSLFNDRAIIYREVRDIDHLTVDLAVRIEPMATTTTDRAAEADLQDASVG
ncbi:pyruvate phosphate dikinase-like enzyme [Kribbella voronezhensis]|uniref:Phosphoenolpyruvate synthase n=1 Tax=Kribbella voronezhensis TaxID=2512212 RepID=A0A4R7SXV4_9ACTN|nr:PEP/pyruvate-binding domain-containing protein [Kribbella voronezhensis]TDU83759.1 pyruvate phosphate dikinase-like enzyme [Kribbella voronezhensis]